ncbi:MAG: acetyl-CoA acetyltransferase [Legionellales bacterium RIFCSPHIGHO2_12_FULL_42_9]|nr:MAG: acetyl-CoA acetyltransferase [Legionellales bacterium RIFCSPHIGHO2_12_FULL_42_9]
MDRNDVVIVAAKRTPIGSFLGVFASLTAPELGAYAHVAAIQQSQINPSELSEIISGCVLQAGLGQAPARQAALRAKIPESVGATTINKMCGSGMQAVMLAYGLIKADETKIILASGMESMSNAPHLFMKSRTGIRIGNAELKDSMYLDGLEDAYDHGKLMGYFAEATAGDFNFSREDQDHYAANSLKLALKAQAEGSFAQEIQPINIQGRTTTTLVELDEGPNPNKFSKISTLKPNFKPDGTITAANSSSISDGAASLIVMNYIQAQQRGIIPLAKIVAIANHAQTPATFPTAPITAIQKVLVKAGWKLQDVDLFEINEAFAVVVMAAIHQLKLDASRVNIHGGACILGHPIGASGARIIVTLIYALAQQKKRTGIAAICIGGGEATAIAIENVGLLC